MRGGGWCWCDTRGSSARSRDECEPHHLDEWRADDGPTDLNNGALFCKYGCHRLLHEGKVRVQGDANHRLDFYDKHDNHLGHSEPRVAPQPVPTDQGRARAKARNDQPADEPDEPDETSHDDAA